MRLIERVCEENLLNPQVLASANENSQVKSDMGQVQRLSKMNLLDEDSLLKLFSSRYGIPILSEASQVVKTRPEVDQVKTIFEATQILPILSGNRDGALLGINSNWLDISQIEFHYGEDLDWYLASRDQISSLMEKGELPDEKSKETVSSLIQRLLEKAINLNASDIHLELQKDFLRVRFRIDGVLQEMGKLSKELSPQIFSRMKILGDMDIAVQRQPQDGHYSYLAKNNSHFDLRISTIPAQKGEKMVLRLLDQIPVTHNLEALGFFEEDLSVLKNACRAASGMVIMVGPTGSGKTTTLYAMLNLINSPSRNILTIENPVEYELPGITQISIDPDQDLDFSKTLRAALRQDPDVILIGEIRDEETAEIAVKAALTGHLVLTTLHSRDALTVIQRLKNLGISADLLSETLNLIVSQKLVRRLCRHHRREKNCRNCRGTGYHGRTPLYEILKLDQNLRDRIRENVSGHALLEGIEGVYFRGMKETAGLLLEQRITDKKELRPHLEGF